MIRKLGLLLILVSMLAAAVPAGSAAGQEEGDRKRVEAPAARPATNTPFLFSAFALTWVVLWGYLVHVHRGQRRLEKMIGASEGKGTGD